MTTMQGGVSHSGAKKLSFVTMSDLKLFHSNVLHSLYAQVIWAKEDLDELVKSSLLTSDVIPNHCAMAYYCGVV